MNDGSNSEEDYEETTTEDINDFNKIYDKWKKDREKTLKHLKQFTDVICPEELRKLINGNKGNSLMT